MEQMDTGLLINERNAKLQRFYFKQAVRLIGIQTKYYGPREGKHYDGYGELETFFYGPISVGVVFEDHPTVWTMRKLGWDVELQEGESLIHVPYDTPNLQYGGVFEIPSGIDRTMPRLFRILRMSMSMTYPSEVVCHIAPLYRSDFDPSLMEHKDNDFNLLRGEEEDDG